MVAEVFLTAEAKIGIEGIKNAIISTRIYELVERLKNWPNVSGCKPLKGILAGHYRMRTGDYRLQFRVETKRVLIVEEKVVKGKPVKVEKEVRQHKVFIEKAGHRDGFYGDRGGIMATKAIGGKISKKHVSLIDKLAQLQDLLHDLGAATTKIANNGPSAAIRNRLTQIVDQVHATIRNAIGNLCTVELDDSLAPMPSPNSEGYYPAAETLGAIIAHQIAERRKKAELSQEELAKRAGVRQETISRLESGKHAPTVRTVEKIDRALSNAKA